MNKNCHNFRTSHVFDTKHGPVTKRNRRNTATSKKIDDDVLSANCDVIYFPFMANLHPSKSRISDPWSIKLIFSLTITFYLSKTENRTEKFLTPLHTIALSKGEKVLSLPKMLDFLQKKMLALPKSSIF